MKQVLKHILLLCMLAALVLVWLAGCGGHKTITAVPEVKSPTELPMSSIGYNHFVNANLLESFGALAEAVKEYQNALKYFPESVTIRTDYARLLFRMSRFSESLEQALLIEPKSSEVCLLVGDCYRLLDNIQPAIEYYRQAVQLDSDNINAYWYLGGYYRQIDQKDSAISAYYELARLSDTYRIWYELGTLLGESGRYKEALSAFGKAISLNPVETNLNAYLGLAAAYEALDSIPQAEETYNRALKLSPDNVTVYRQMLSMYLGRQDIKKSIEISQSLVSLMPSDWPAQRRLGILYYSDGQLERADSLFASRIDFGDDNALNFFYRGRVAMEKGRLDDAKRYFIEVTKRESSFTDGWLNLGFIYSEQDSLPKAIDIYREGLRSALMTEDSARLNFALGAALERNGLFYQAVETFRGVIASDSNNAQALNYLGYMLADRGEQLPYALGLIERALRLAPDNPAYIDSYGWVCYKMGNYAVALSELQKAVGLLSNDAVIYEHLGDVYKSMGNMIEAERHYRRALEIDPDSIIIEEKLKQ